MSKPDWKDAPEWAMWLAADDDGWTWFEKEPVVHEIDGNYVCGIHGGGCRVVIWGDTQMLHKEKRPC